MFSPWFQNQYFVASNQQSWHMPDGSKTAIKPKDGEKWSRVTYQGDTETWQWDDIYNMWYKCVGNQHSGVQWRDGSDISDKTVATAPKCDCGSDTVGSPRHSSYCDKYDPKS